MTLLLAPPDMNVIRNNRRTKALGAAGSIVISRNAYSDHLWLQEFDAKNRGKRMHSGIQELMI